MPKPIDDERPSLTHGDIARAQLLRLGVPFFGDIQDDVRERLTRLSPEGRTAFAVACASRVMESHLRLPKEEQRAFSIGWRPVLDAIWRGLERQSDESARFVIAALDRFHASPYDHADGQDGPDDADDNAAAASIYAAECFLSANAESAYCSASRALDVAFDAADDDLTFDDTIRASKGSAKLTPLAVAAMHPLVQAELKIQLSHMDRLEREGLSAALLQELRGEFA